MTKAVQVYTGISTGILGAAALALGAPFIVVGLCGLGVCYGFTAENSTNEPTV